MNEPEIAGDLDAAALEARLEAGLDARPSGEFVDGFLAGLAIANAAASGGAATLYYSFEWIGDGQEERDQALYEAFQSDRNRMQFDVVELPDWRGHVDGLARKWLARHLPPEAAPAVAQEFREVMEAFLGDDPVDAFAIEALPPDGETLVEPPIGDAYDHVLFETPAGRIFLEFSVVA